MSENVKSQAAEYVRLLISTGMAHEFSADSIAYRSWMDGYEAGEASMAYLVRELGRNRAALQMLVKAEEGSCDSFGSESIRQLDVALKIANAVLTGQPVPEAGT